MEIIFAKEYLKELHIKGTSPDKHHRYQPSVIKRYQKTIDRLAAARRIEDLYNIQSLHYEKLRGNKTDISSVRVTDKYRIEFEEITVEGKEFVSICNILELSNHYN